VHSSATVLDKQLDTESMGDKKAATTTSDPERGGWLKPHEIDVGDNAASPSIQAPLLLESLPNTNRNRQPGGLRGKVRQTSPSRINISLSFV
jgi:hypothetical protein